MINVTWKVTNDGDSGTVGYWALDDYVKHIQVFETSPGVFCATASYLGDFTSVQGKSPGATGSIANDVVGTFEGGYIIDALTGTLNPSPVFKTNGNIGSRDYGCTITSGSESCTNVFDWIGAYFSSVTGGDTLNWWGWTYHAGSDGSWVDASSGITGDITGN